VEKERQKIPAVCFLHFTLSMQQQKLTTLYLPTCKFLLTFTEDDGRLKYRIVENFCSHTFMGSKRKWRYMGGGGLTAQIMG
jgi:hypothetical protein